MTPVRVSSERAPSVKKARLENFKNFLWILLFGLSKPNIWMG